MRTPTGFILFIILVLLFQALPFHEASAGQWIYKINKWQSKRAASKPKNAPLPALNQAIPTPSASPVSLASPTVQPLIRLAETTEDSRFPRRAGNPFPFKNFCKSAASFEIIVTSKALGCGTDPRFTEKLNEIIRPEMSDFEKVLAIHDFVVGKMTFAPHPEATAMPAALSALLHGSAPYLGHWSLFAELIHAANIPVISISGNAGSLTMGGQMMNCETMITSCAEGGTNWFKVRLDGKWYNIDPYWNDPYPGTGPVLHEFFLVPDWYMALNHVIYEHVLLDGTPMTPEQIAEVRSDTFYETRTVNAHRPYSEDSEGIFAYANWHRIITRVNKQNGAVNTNLFLPLYFVEYRFRPNGAAVYTMKDHLVIAELSQRWNMPLFVNYMKKNGEDNLLEKRFVKRGAFYKDDKWYIMHDTGPLQSPGTTLFVLSKQQTDTIPVPEGESFQQLYFMNKQVHAVTSRGNQKILYRVTSGDQLELIRILDQEPVSSFEPYVETPVPGPLKMAHQYGDWIYGIDPSSDKSVRYHLITKLTETLQQPDQAWLLKTKSYWPVNK